MPKNSEKRENLTPKTAETTLEETQKRVPHMIPGQWIFVIHPYVSHPTKSCFPKLFLIPFNPIIQKVEATQFQSIWFGIVFHFLTWGRIWN